MSSLSIETRLRSRLIASLLRYCIYFPVRFLLQYRTVHISFFKVTQQQEMKEAVRDRKSGGGNSNLKPAVACCFFQSRNNHRGVDGFADFTNIQAAFGRVDMGCSAIQGRSQDSHCTQKVTQKFVSMFNCPPTHKQR